MKCDDFIKAKGLSAQEGSTPCNICIYHKTHGCDISKRDNKTSMVHEPVKSGRRVFG